MIRSISVLAATIVLGLNVTEAAFVQNVTVAAVSSESAGLLRATDQRRATNLLSGAGLYNDFHSVDAQGSMWLTSVTTAGAYTNAFVVFDLGEVRTLEAMKVWNYNESGTTNFNRGIQRAAISYSTDNVTFTTNLPNQLFAKAPGVFTPTPRLAWRST
ncbi:MAG: DUF4457 domain-containing protein [Verrucomicrobiota bacterium]